MTYSLNTGQASSLGQIGSIHVAGTGTITAPTGYVFIAIQFLETTIFASDTEGLVTSVAQRFPDSTTTSTFVDADGGAVVDGEAFPQGMTIYGRWSGFKLTSGRVIGYIGFKV